MEKFYKLPLIQQVFAYWIQFGDVQRDGHTLKDYTNRLFHGR